LERYLDNQQHQLATKARRHEERTKKKMSSWQNAPCRRSAGMLLNSIRVGDSERSYFDLMDLLRDLRVFVIFVAK
jgi:hypothetical protein